jgi:hypothetical protein
VPPPQVQLEEVNRQARIKKDAESGDPGGVVRNPAIAAAAIAVVKVLRFKIALPRLIRVIHIDGP